MQSGKIRITGSYHGITATYPCVSDGWTGDGLTRVILTGDGDKRICPSVGCLCGDGVRLYARGEFFADGGAKRTDAVIVDSRE